MYYFFLFIHSFMYLFGWRWVLVASCGSWAQTRLVVQIHGHSSCRAGLVASRHVDLGSPTRIEPYVPRLLQGRFLTTGPSGSLGNLNLACVLRNSLCFNITTSSSLTAVVLDWQWSANLKRSLELSAGSISSPAWSERGEAINQLWMCII